MVTRDTLADVSQQLTAVEIPTPRTYRDYSPEFKAHTLALVKSNNGNVLRTAKELGLDESVIRLWLRQQSRYRSLSEQKVIELAEKAEFNAHLLADSIADHDLETASLAQKATAMGIMVDKMQLLRGQPTSISISLGRDDINSFLSSSLSDIIDITPEPTGE